MRRLCLTPWCRESRASAPSPSPSSCAEKAPAHAALPFPVDDIRRNASRSFPRAPGLECAPRRAGRNSPRACRHDTASQQMHARDPRLSTRDMALTLTALALNALNSHAARVNHPLPHVACVISTTPAPPALHVLCTRHTICFCDSGHLSS